MFSLLDSYRDVFRAAVISTLWLNSLALLFGLPLALTLFALRTSRIATIRFAAAAVNELLKGLPALVVMFWLFLCLPLVSSWRVSAGTAAIIALALNYAVGAAEILRSAWQAVEPDLRNGLGLQGIPRFAGLAFFEAPLLITSAAPGLLAQLATTIKLSAIAAFIGYEEVFHATQGLIQQTYRPVELYTALAFFYVALVLAISGCEAAFRRFRAVPVAPDR